MTGFTKSKPANETLMSGFTRDNLPSGQETVNSRQIPWPCRRFTVSERTILTMSALLPGNRLYGLDGLFQHAAHCRRGLIDACKRGQRDRQIHRGHTFMILAR